MSRPHLGLRVSDALNDALEEAAHAAQTSKSELARHFLAEALLEDGDVDLPAYLREELERERRKRRNRLTWQRIHFPSNVADRFKRAFEQGDLDAEINPGAIEELEEIYLEEAEGLFTEDDERREAALEFVEALADHAREASDVSEFNRLDPEELFEHYSGVREAREREESLGSMDGLVDDAHDLITDDVGGVVGDPAVPPAETIEILSSRSDVDRELAELAVDRAIDRLSDGPSGRQALASDGGESE